MTHIKDQSWDTFARAHAWGEQAFPMLTWSSCIQIRNNCLFLAINQLEQGYTSGVIAKQLLLACLGRKKLLKTEKAKSTLFNMKNHLTISKFSITKSIVLHQECSNSDIHKCIQSLFCRQVFQFSWNGATLNAAHKLKKSWITRLSNLRTRVLDREISLKVGEAL